MITRANALRPEALPPLPSLPEVVRTRDGQEIEPIHDTWELRKRADGGQVFRLAWTDMTFATARMVQVTKLILAHRLSGYAAMSTWNDFAMLRRLNNWFGQNGLDWSLVDEAFGRRWLAHGTQNTKNAGNDFARLRDLYRYGMQALQLPEFDPQVLIALEGIKAPGNAKGNAVRAGDPEKGQFTPPEIDLILEKLASPLTTAQERAMVLLCMETGRNALAYTLCRTADLLRVSAGGPDGPWTYQLRVRRLKKRTTTDGTRNWPISETLGALLWSLRRPDPDAPLLWWLDQDTAEHDLGQKMTAWAKRVDLRSPRTGEPMVLNARRFRVTMLTNAADEGASPEHLAILADHEDLQNIGVYIDRSPLFLQRIQAKVDAIYDPMVKRFKGTVTTKAEAERTNARIIPGVAVQLPLLNVGGIGACGHDSLCRLAPPLTCYTCPKFVAFTDGPHAEVVEALEASMRSMDERVGLQVANALAAAREVAALTTKPRGAAEAK